MAAFVVDLEKVADFVMGLFAHAFTQDFGRFQHYLAAAFVEAFEFVVFQAAPLAEGEMPQSKRISSL